LTHQLYELFPTISCKLLIFMVSLVQLENATYICINHTEVVI